tara:strand:- start:1006 stop:1530 length:525 start_codon:yes stop_codon:yes gene_type:complete
MSKPYQTETYDEEEDIKQYINLENTFDFGSNNFIGTTDSPVQYITVGDNTGISYPPISAGSFTNIIKSNLINYSNEIITINKSGNYIINFTGNVYFTHTRAFNVFFKKNNITIAELAIQVSRQLWQVQQDQIYETFSTISPIFNANNGDSIKIDLGITDLVGFIINFNIFLQEI